MLITSLIPILLRTLCFSSKNGSKKYWDEKWQVTPHAQNKANPFAIKAMDYIKNNFKENGIKLLDLGSGNGRDSLFFANSGAYVFAMDISEKALSALKEKNQNIVTNSQNFEHLNLQKNSFDVIYAHLSLHYFSADKTIDILHTIKSALKPGGLFFIKVKSVHDWQYGEGKQITPYIFHDGHTRHFFSVERLKTMLSKFNIIEIMESKDNYNGKNNAFIEAVVSNQ